MPKKPTQAQTRLEPDFITETLPDAEKNKKLSKKEARVQDAQLRDEFTTDTGKEDTVKITDGPKIKDDYEAFEKRPFDRHSGTGRPAFKKNDFKKGGFGKGNVGAINTGSDLLDEAMEMDDDDVIDENIAVPDTVDIGTSGDGMPAGQIGSGPEEQNVRVVGEQEFQAYKNANKDLAVDTKNGVHSTDLSQVNNEINGLKDNETEFPSLP